MKAFLQRSGLSHLRHVAVFLSILFGFHLVYTLLIDKETLMIPGLEGLYLYLRHLLFVHSAWVAEHILGMTFTTGEFALRFEGHGALLVDESCSAVKWFAHFLVLMLIFPGPWKHKLWFIPAGIVVTHVVNIIRITGLAVVFVNRPDAFEFYHDWIFRPFFYLVLFLMWVLWVEKFYLARKTDERKRINQEGSGL